MKKIFILIGLLTSSIQSLASLHPLPVSCSKMKNSANCVVFNESARVLSCEVLVLSETGKGKLQTLLKDVILQPLETEVLQVKSENILHSGGEAHCKSL